MYMVGTVFVPFSLSSFFPKRRFGNMSTQDESTNTFNQEVTNSPFWRRVYEHLEKEDYAKDKEIQRKWSPPEGTENLRKYAVRSAASTIESVLGKKFVVKHRATAFDLCKQAVAGGSPRKLLEDTLEIRESIMEAKYSGQMEIPEPVGLTSDVG